MSSIAASDKKAIQNRLGLVIQTGYASGYFGFGTYSYDRITGEYTWHEGLSFRSDTENGVTTTKLLLNANNVEINANVTIRGESVRFGNNSQYTVGDVIDDHIEDALDSFTVLAKHIGFTASDLNITAGDVNFNSGSYTINALSHIDFTGCEFGVKASNITFDTSIGAGNINFTTGTFTIGADHINFSGKTVDLSSSTVNLNSTNLTLWARFIDFTYETLDLTGANIDLTVVDTLTINAGQLNYSGENIDLTSAYLTLNAGQLNYQGEYINLSVANVNIGADQITFGGKTITIAANNTLTFTSGTVGSGQTKGTIDFTGAKINMNADQLTFVGKTVINGKFTVDNSGNVTMTNMTANHATIQNSELTNVKVNGIMASPFVVENSEITWIDGNEYYAAKAHDII